jgi:putative DNA primase/helicase
MKHEKLHLRPDGLYVEEPSGRRRLSGRAEVIAFGQYENSDNFVAIIRFDVGDTSAYIICPLSDLRKPGILSDLLVNKGFDLPLDRHDRQLVLNYLAASNPPQRWVILRRTGWWRDTYVLADRAYGPEADQVCHEAAFCGRGIGIGSSGTSSAMKILGSAAHLGSAGSLDDWKTVVAVPLSGSSRTILAISSALTAYLMHPLGLENGGYHIPGDSSAGKTSMALFGRSVSGRAVRSELTTWKTTEAGSEIIAMENCDLLLILDEIAQLDPDPVRAGKRARDIVFHLCSGNPKSRGNGYNQQLPGPTWRAFIFSTGVAPLSDLATAAGLSRDDGDNVRLIDVPLAGDRTSIFDLTPLNSADGEALCRELEHAVGTRCYGTAGPALIERFVEKRDEHLQLLEGWMADFVAQAGVPETRNGGWERRFVRRFAACYAVGRLATKLDILPWSEDLVRKAVVTCYRDARQAMPNADTILKDGLERLRIGLEEASILDARSGLEGIKSREIAEADGFRRKLKEPRRSFLAIKAEVFRAWLDDAQQRQLVLNKLDSEGLLMRQRSRTDNFTKQVKVAGINGKAYYYCLRWRVLGWLEKQ